MIERTLSARLETQAQKMPVLAVTGPRQSGKTTLIRSIFPNHTYLNLEFPDIRQRAQEDPRLLLSGSAVILDEVQRVPDLLSYVQGFVDENNKPGQYILTGSQNLLLLEKISQSLAGRVSLFNLLPFGVDEIRATINLDDDYLSTLFNGMYPRLYDQNLQAQEWYPSYIQSYIERDVRQIVNVKDISKFQTFVRLCAGRIGQLFNASAIATELGVDFKTVQSWASILEASFVIFFLRPFHKNYNKRLVKSPKLYFYDTGLACSVLGIRSPDDLFHHFLRGELFESFILSELMKHKFHSRQQAMLYFWRDNSGHEIDCLIEDGSQLKAVEIKSGTTFNTNFMKNLQFWQSLTGISVQDCFVVYGGTEQQRRSHATALGWKGVTTCYAEH